MDDAAVEDGIRREIQDPSSITPASEVMSPSAAEPSAPRSAPVMLSNKPASEVVAPAAAETFATPFRRNKPVPRTPSLGCKNCEVLFAEVKVVRQLLDVKVAANDELKKLHSSMRRETAARSNRHKPFSLSNAPPYVKLVEGFKEHTEGRHPTQNTRRNARQRASHVLYFLRFMSEPALPDLNLLFLKDHGRIRKFTDHLIDKNLKPMTIRSYLTDAAAFVRYICSMAPGGVKIGRKSLSALLVELRVRKSEVSRSVQQLHLSQPCRKSSKITSPHL
ncbi:uncharacterized protein LOC114551750 [Perca flavescens]|uniref:uncharacterized protein LOC114551750 n=1 Tax=Perca flavescens TaxID=8167 RepID=UPI00106E9FA1|nr:uncharacterized protein LOC114551750 [Perca flavescens]